MTLVKNFVFIVVKSNYEKVNHEGHDRMHKEHEEIFLKYLNI